MFHFSQDKALNLQSAKEAISRAATLGCSVVALPEVFNGPYATSSFAKYAEKVPRAGHTEPLDAIEYPSCSMLQQAAADHKVYIIGGSIAESNDGKLYNTSTVWCPKGHCIAKHRKVHLFDIDIPGKITFQESDVLTAGDNITTFDTPWGIMGLAICYDIRFPALATCMRKAGAMMLWYPGAFNMTTGPKHWELLARARAVDNQCFVATISPARNPDSEYQAWGHSTVVSPWAEVVATTDHSESCVVTELDLAEIATVRQNIPVSKQERSDLYTVAAASSV
jgi:omega-amidase